MLFRDQTPSTTATSSTTTPSSSTKTYLNVPYAEKDEAKALGAKWDPSKRQWYAPNAEPSLVNRWAQPAKQARQLDALEGEDRTFGPDGLYIDLMPKSCWCKKIRYAMERDEVDRVHDLVCGRVNRTCEACGVQDMDKRFEIHGRWSYDDTTNTQKLVRLVAMCEDCFDVTHFGAASYGGRRDRAMAHWQQVTGRTYEECKSHVDAAYERMNMLNQTEWKVDLSLLTGNGVVCAKGDSRGFGGGGGGRYRSSAVGKGGGVQHRDHGGGGAGLAEFAFRK